MNEEFNLSKKVIKAHYFEDSDEVLDVEIVKEFIRLLKDEIEYEKSDESIETIGVLKVLSFKLDKLAGSELSEVKE